MAKTDVGLREAIVRTLLYADIFAFPLSVSEIAHYLIGARATPESIAAALHTDPWLAERVFHSDGFYCLVGREATIPARLAHAALAHDQWTAAHRWGHVLAHLPFVRAVILTGALAVNNAQERGDLDYLIITHPGRLWLTRAGATLLVRVAALVGARLCPNYLLAETALHLDERNLFTAHEVIQMTPLYGSAVHHRMRQMNHWADAYLPQAARPLRDEPRDRLHPLVGPLKRAAEWALSGRLGSTLEGWIQRRKIAQLRREAPAHADRSVFSADCCKGHFEGHGQRILARYAAQLASHGLADPIEPLPVAPPLPSHPAPDGASAPHTVRHLHPQSNGHRPTIAFDATTLRGSKTGVGYYTSNLLSHLLAEDPDHDYLLLSNRAVEGAPGGRPLPPRYLFPNRSIWMQTLLPLALRAERPALCHFTNSVAPLPSNIPFVVTIHDMTLSLFPRLHPLRKHLVTRPLIPFVARQARRIITVSHSAKRDIVRLLRVPPSKVHVIYEAAAPAFRPLPTAEVERVRDRYGLHGRYILYVGTIEPRKNLPRLIEAFARLHQAGLPHKLLLVGQPGWHFKPVYQRIADLSLIDHVIFTGYVPSDDLVALYNLADVFAFPSLYEGFGLPMIEAMACGTPVVTTRASSLGEIAGDAALTINPLSVDDLATGLSAVLTEPARSQTLRERGLERARSLSWSDAARQTLGVYQEVLRAAH